jgi:hypothetical protein
VISRAASGWPAEVVIQAGCVLPLGWPRLPFSLFQFPALYSDCFVIPGMDPPGSIQHSWRVGVLPSPPWVSENNPCLFQRDTKRASLQICDSIGDHRRYKETIGLLAFSGCSRDVLMPFHPILDVFASLYRGRDRHYESIVRQGAEIICKICP